jgi:hypothetical protein
VIRIFILWKGCRFDLDRQTVTEGDITLPLHPDWHIWSDDPEAYTNGWQEEPGA